MAVPAEFAPPLSSLISAMDDDASVDDLRVAAAEMDILTLGEIRDELKRVPVDKRRLARKAWLLLYVERAARSANGRPEEARDVAVELWKFFGLAGFKS